MTTITGNTYPVKDSLKALGARWNPDQKAWMVSDDKAEQAYKIVAQGGSSQSTPRPFRHTKCVTCGVVQRLGAGPRGHRYPEPKILKSGECVDCYEERKMGY
jgi:hypothetical protein